MIALAEVEVQTRLQYVLLAGELALAQDDAATAWAHLSHVIADDFRSNPGRSLPIYAEAARALARLRADAATEVDVDDAEKRLRASAARPTRAGRRPVSGPRWSTPSSAAPSRTGDDVAAWQRALERRRGASGAGRPLPAVEARDGSARGRSAVGVGHRPGADHRGRQHARGRADHRRRRAPSPSVPGCRSAGRRDVTRPAQSSSPHGSSRCST